MKSRTLNFILIVGAFLFAGCAQDFIKPKQAQIDQYIQSHPDLPEVDKTCISDGRFEIGILAETVQFLLGEPKKLETIQQPWAVQQKWIYKRGNQKVFIIEDKHVVGILEQD